MTKQQKQYYYEMAKRNRLLMLYDVNGKSGGLITFFIGNGNIHKYIREDMWSIIKDEPKTGNTLYIDHLLTSKNRNNPYVSLCVWRDIKRYIKNTYPLIKRIRWNRFKEKWGKPKTFKEEI